MKALQRKLWRDFWRLRGQALAIALVVIGGISTMVMAVTNHASLSDTRDRFYQGHGFADVFAQLKRAPNALLGDVAALPGVARVQGRVSTMLTLDLAAYTEAVTAQAIALPDSAQDSLNRLFLREGTLPGRPDEVVVGEAFALAHQLHPGDGFSAVINGRRQALRISGIGLSPEFIYQIRPGDMFPDFERFAVMWMPRQALAAAMQMEGAFNQLSLQLAPGARAADVITALDHLLLPYGGVGAHDRSQQLSHRFLDEELKQLSTMTRLFSAIFLGVSAFLLNVVIGRVIATQREQIAVLKAFGYSRWQVTVHFGQLVLLMVAVGIVPGMAIGAWMGRGMAGIYAEFYRFPFLTWGVQPEVLALSVAFGLAVAALGTASGLRQAFALLPAEAMRPESPPVFHRTLTERVGLGPLLDGAARMVVRNLERRPLRSLLSILGMGLACGMLVMTHLQGDAIDEMIAVQFGLAQRDDLAVGFSEPTGARVIQELQALPGVLAVEAQRTVAVRLRHGHRSHTTGLQGMAARGDLKRVLDADLVAVPLPDQGLLLTDYLADMLDVRVGDVIDVELQEGRRETLRLPVAATVTEYLGVGVYARREWVNQLLQEGDVVSGAWLKVAPADKPALIDRLRQRPRVAAVTDRNASVASFRQTMAQSMLTFTLVATLMAASMAGGVVYNAARITLAERARDLASLRILGYTQAEVRALLLGELATLTLLALLPGFALGYGMSALLVWGMQSELYRVPLVVLPSGLALAGAVLLGAAALSAWLVLARLRRLDLVAVLKTRE